MVATELAAVVAEAAAEVADVAADEAEVAALANTMLDTTVIVDVLGTVYRVVLDVAAAVLARAWVNVAISYYLS